MRPARPLPILIAAVLVIGAGLAERSGSVVAGNDCKVSLTAGLNNTRPGDHKTKYTFGVAANTAESCADVTYVLLVSETLADGTSKTTELPGEVRVRSQTRIGVLDYETDARSKITGFEAKLKSCTLCEAP